MIEFERDDYLLIFMVTIFVGAFVTLAVVF
jgi:hypothetical protein